MLSTSLILLVAAIMVPVVLADLRRNERQLAFAHGSVALIAAVAFVAALTVVGSLGKFAVSVIALVAWDAVVRSHDDPDDSGCKACRGQRQTTDPHEH